MFGRVTPASTDEVARVRRALGLLARGKGEEGYALIKDMQADKFMAAGSWIQHEAEIARSILDIANKHAMTDKRMTVRQILKAAAAKGR